MPETKRKHLSEFAVSLCTKSILLISSSQITSDGEMRPEEKAVSDECHIYLICRLPMLSFDPNHFKYNGLEAEGNLIYRIEGNERKVPFKIPFPLLDGAVEVKITDYPHREMRTYDNEGNMVRYMPANAVALNYGLHAENEELSNLNVLYVGQAFGDGNRTAFDRLRSHSTLQKILAEAQYESPDSEIFLFLFEYDHYRIITSMNANAQETGDKDTERFFSIIDNPLTEKQQICLAEAGLIRYFQPRYNKIYKESFPQQDQKILTECFELDFSGLIVEINTEDLLFQLSSESISPNSHHIAQFNLVNHDDRWGFFHFLDKDGHALPLEGIINGIEGS